MHIALEILITLLKVVKSLLVSIVFALLPAPKKSVDGEIVLITGINSHAIPVVNQFCKQD